MINQTGYDFIETKHMSNILKVDGVDDQLSLDNSNNQDN